MWQNKQVWQNFIILTYVTIVIKVTSLTKHEKCDKNKMWTNCDKGQNMTSVGECDKCSKIWQVWQNMTDVTKPDKCYKMWQKITSVTKHGKCDKLWQVWKKITKK